MKPTLVGYGALLLCLLVTTVGCVREGGTTAGLPMASATLHWAKIDLQRGSYCWNFGNRRECADSPGHEQLLKTSFRKPYRSAGGFDVLITFKGNSQPVGFNAEVLTTGGKLLPVQESAPHTFSLGTVTAAESGVYVYVVTGKWTEGSMSFYLTLDLIPGVA